MEERLVTDALNAEITTITKLMQVIIWRPRECGPLIGLDFDWKYDEEHGLGVLVLGNAIFETSAADIAHPIIEVE